ncbi:uncharacterized protein N7500_007082 [Penicillium coprophilum]|uniref:uncharacterized protein n=1 Tax=Penicillium coprophilum TaxID=36646 RepID=UPI002382923D|nr:uncharacterized protein N7500_007082 [Penicillium coprophilum]KAJ5165252.1 hypothetical protein N7500_007082 [Penicillium coprophilum]
MIPGGAVNDTPRSCVPDFRSLNQSRNSYRQAFIFFEALVHFPLSIELATLQSSSEQSSDSIEKAIAV